MRRAKGQQDGATGTEEDPAERHEESGQQERTPGRVKLRNQGVQAQWLPSGRCHKPRRASAGGMGLLLSLERQGRERS